ncbi:MAG: hypothetical protein M3Q18_14520 [Actinomycetota bacterium]|nr:hypothetical protein [Actinomycetota bacterium]
MERREFLQRGLVLAAAGAGSAVVGSRVAEAATTLYSDAFRRAKTTKGWGKSWYSPRYEMPWGISSHKGYFVLDPEGNADPLNPSPVLVLNKDVRDVDIIAKIYSRNKDARFGLVARYVNYGDFYACYVDRNHVRLSRFTMRGEQVLDKAQIPEQTDTGFMIRFHVSGGDKTALKAKVWRAGRVQPRNWTVSKTHTDSALAKAAPYGCVFLHDAAKKWTATMEISKFKATSSQTKQPSAPYSVFSYAGRFTTDQGLRARVVARTTVPAKVRFEWSTQLNFANSHSSDASGYVKRASVAKGWLANLPANSLVYWRAVATTGAGGQASSPVHTLRTPPAAGQKITLAFGSCTDFNVPNPSFERAAARGADFFVHLGDFGYAAFGTRSAVSRTAGSYQDRWTRMLASSDVSSMTKKGFWIGCQDDQDYGRGDAWSGDHAKFTISAWDQLSGNLDQRYFAVRYGDAHLFFTDSCRFSDKRDSDTGDSMLGAKQKAWLKNAMLNSKAPVLVLFMPRQLSHVENNFKNEYDELVSFFKGRVRDGHAVLICSGNSHLQYMGQHPSAYTQEEAYEFCSSGTDRAGQRSIPTNAIKNREDGINAFGLVEIDRANNTLNLKSIGSDTGNVILEKTHSI